VSEGVNSSSSVGRGGAAAAAATWVRATMAAQHGLLRPRLRRREELQRLPQERRLDGDFLAFVDVRSGAGSTC
jgi:hypothetical protein